MFLVALPLVSCLAWRVSCFRFEDELSKYEDSGRLHPNESRAYDVFDELQPSESQLNGTLPEKDEESDVQISHTEGFLPQSLPEFLTGDIPSSTGREGLEIPKHVPSFYPMIAKVLLVGALLAAFSGCYLAHLTRCERESDGARAVITEGSTSKALSNKVRFAYCLPTIGTLPVSALISVFGMALYSQRGADMSTMALAVALARSFDVVSDPLMSYATDSCRHATGRRRPFMIMGAPAYGLFVAALLAPPFVPSASLSIWFAVMYVMYYLCNTVTNIPYDALGPEISEDSFDRARLFFLSGIFDGGGTALALGAPSVGYKVASYFDWAQNICRAHETIASQCANGMSCARFEEYGNGNEFVENLTFASNASLEGHDCDAPGSQVAEPGVAAYCDCIRICLTACSSARRSYGYKLTGLFFALWYVCTSYWCCHVVKERPAPPEGRARSPPLVPSVLGVLQNPAFRILLPAWAFDAVAQAIFLSLCPFFVMYVIAPEYQTPRESSWNLDCREGARAESFSRIYDRRCSTQVVLGSCVGVALVCAMLTTPIWLRMVVKFGKVKVWLAWSFSMAVTNFMFLFLTKGAIISTLIVCGFNGIPLAAKFLADSILSDIIDYDEFLTGRRNEATYTMFKSFLPKVMAIPASALPLAIINAAGHVPVDHGRIRLQPQEVRLAVSLMAGGASGLAALVAFYIKRKYPLDTEEKVSAVTEGIKNHKAGEKAIDPISGQEYSLITFTEQENTDGVWAMDHFSSIKLIEDMAIDPQGSLSSLLTSCTWEVVVAFTILLASLAALVTTIPLLRDAKLAFIPTMSAVALGVSLLCSGFSLLRRKAAYKLQQKPPAQDLVQKVLRSRVGRQVLTKQV
eukprot:TRINITY_DN106105_c0_g1_i1.p1 TRINITY_DN106105_c0_g1~~TRINITY_DN106105_c0_g1_i1.p1  ORF type:complete len:861 (-),score=91.66 TRINITY_DN106105_c0_g1_i1:78-2660(-)